MTNKPYVLQTITKYLDQQTSERTARERIAEIDREFTEGFRFIAKYPKSVTFFGSSKSVEGDPYYEKARELAGRLAKEAGYTIVSGGGPGIMEAADRGAYEVGGNSVGLTIKLPDGQPTNKYIKESIGFYYFFVRKVCLAFGAEVFIFFPGGYGTLDEFFEIITLIQTRKISGTPIVCYGSEYWNKLRDLMKDGPLASHMISEDDLKLIKITDNLDEIVEIAKKAKMNIDVPFDPS